MNKQVNQIGFLGAAVVGLTCFVTPANSATLQTSEQIALVNGNNIQVTQRNQQTSLDLFFFDFHLDNKNIFETNSIKNFISSEIDEFIDIFSETDLVDQSISQFAQLLGNNNQITQISDQNIFDVFFLDPELKTDRNSNISDTFSRADISQTLSDRVTEKLPDIKQSVTQKADSFGENNRVNQINEQTVIDFFLIDIKFSTQLDDIVVRRADERLTDWVDFDLDNFLDDLETIVPFTELTNSFFQNNNPIILESNNYNINKISSASIPEPSFLFGLLALGTLGVNATLSRK
jgi:hypothetical protein